MAVVGFSRPAIGSSACEAGPSSVGAGSGTPAEPWLLAISMGSLPPGKAVEEGRATAPVSWGTR
eukprot:2009010-Alexandrium_andersonii.AAC.1